MSFVDILNPVKIVSFFCSIFILLAIIVLGGYLGKYWIEKPDLDISLSVNDRLAQSDFWIPNGHFWGSAIMTLVIIFIIYCLWESIKIFVKKTLNFLFCDLPFRCCCCFSKEKHKVTTIDKEKTYRKLNEDV